MSAVDFASGGSLRAVRETSTRRQLVNVYVTGRSGTRLLLVMTEPELLAAVRELLAAGDKEAADVERMTVEHYAGVRR